MIDATASRPRAYWPELDALRGLAAVLMVLNHAGVLWLGEDARGLDEALTFMGGLAPVFFFMVTGTGRGVQSAGRANNKKTGDTLRKVGLLLLADVALWISPNRLLGMDFLGFIALSTLVVEGVQRTRRPALTASLLAAFVLGVRFALAPLLDLGEPMTSAQAVGRFLLGDRSLAGFAYPPCPWLAYPLFGYLLGRVAQRHADTVRARRMPVAGALGLSGGLGLAICYVLAQRGMIFFRWGTLSVAYTLFGFCALVCGAAIVVALERAGRARALIALPGTSSLVVVPIHYLLIHVLHEATPELARDGRFLPVVLIVIALALGISRAIDRVLTALAKEQRGASGYWLGTLATALVLTVATAYTTGSLPRLMVMTLAQLAISALFPLPFPGLSLARARPAKRP